MDLCTTEPSVTTIPSYETQIIPFDLNAPPSEDFPFDLNDVPHEDTDGHQTELLIVDASDDQDIDALVPSNESYWRKLEFVSVTSCREFYREYAKEQGFSIRTQYARVGRKTEFPEYVMLTCNKAGFKKDSQLNPKNQNQTLEQQCEPIVVTNNQSAQCKCKCKRKRVRKRVKVKLPKYKRPETRTGCGAYMYFRWCKVREIYYIDRWVGDHNHSLHDQQDAFMLKSNRQITPAQALFAETAQRAGLRLRSSYDLMCIQAGGRDCLGFLKEDLKNHLNRRRQKDMRRGEGTRLMEHFRERAFTSPLFYYDVEVDQDERIANIFWADERMQQDYASFGDVVTFDTTFRTNKAYRPLAVFIGFNHHRETCVFGAALLYDETAESFKWLFKTFLRCMREKHPLTIFTDQDAAMAVAIPLMFPSTYHGLCTWHLMQNGAKNMGSKFTKTFCQNLRRLMYEVESEDQFQTLWDSMIEDSSRNSGSGAHWWMKRIYYKRRQWSWAWMRYHFTTGIRSTQLVESFNATIKDFLQSDYHIDEFFTHFDRMIDNNRMRERQSDFNAVEKLRLNEFPSSLLLSSASKVYTEKIFHLLHKQYTSMLSYRAIPLTNDIHCPCKYFKVYRTFFGSDDDIREVFVDTSTLDLKCSCLMFENFGILCCHVLRVMDLLGSTTCDKLMTIPEKYILKRWTVRAKVGCHNSSIPNMGKDGIPHDPHQLLVMKLMKLAGQACARADFHSKITEEVDRLCAMMDDLINTVDHTPYDTTATIVGSSIVPTQAVQPVLLVRENTIKSRRRLKSALELRREDGKKKKKNNQEP